MDDSKTVEKLAKLIQQAAKSANFCAAGCLPSIDPGLAVEGLGSLTLPLKRTKTKPLIAACQVAPYGQGTKTLVNTNVRNTFELDPQTFTLSEAWNTAIAAILRPIAEELGLPPEQLEARLYKLLVYEKGGFFLPHRDSEKHNRMVASLIVVLPNPFEGGALVVKHGGEKQTLTFKEAANGTAPCYAAFYADCEHEVQRVTKGVRLCVAYNLVLKAKRVKKAASPDVLADAIGSWVAKQPGQPLVFALEHHYTQHGLSLDLLKGGDRNLANLVVAAAEKTDCLVHLAQVSRHLCQAAEDGSYEGRYSRYSRGPRGAIEIGETYEDELGGKEWTEVDGKKQPWGEIDFEPSSIVSSVPLDDWKPTSEEYEGYTGNAGNTLERWYHRSAVVVWHREQHFDVIASSGLAGSLPLFDSMATKLAKTPKKRLEEARSDCIRFARAIIAIWKAPTFGYPRPSTEEKALYENFPDQLLALRDRDTIALFLTHLAQQDRLQPLRSFVLAACREFGWSAFAKELKQLLAAPPNPRGRQELPFRDVEWLAAFCCDKTADPDKLALGQELCALAVDRFCEPLPQRPTYGWFLQDQEASKTKQSFSLLLKALVASRRDQDLERVIHFVQAAPEKFNLDDYQVPCLKLLVPWTQQHLGFVPPPLASWLVSVRQQLEAAAGKQPTPPTDWRRPVEVACNCQYCGKLKTFLADPANKVGRIPAREDFRNHVVHSITQHQCDVNHELERKGSPYSLLLTKTNGSYDRAVKRYEADRKHLSELPVCESSQ